MWYVCFIGVRKYAKKAVDLPDGIARIETVHKHGSSLESLERFDSFEFLDSPLFENLPENQQPVDQLSELIIALVRYLHYPAVKGAASR